MAPTPSPGASTGTGAGRSFRNDIEGLRAVAVVLVVLAHAGVPALAGGFVGVDVFLVISGYLITGLLLTEADREGRPSILRFYARRVRRILPMAALVAVATVVASYAAGGPAYGNRTADDARWVAVFAGNLHFAAQRLDYFGGLTSPLEHFWSLGVEEQFYLVWPLLVVALCLLVRGSRRRAVLAAALVVICVASVAWSVHQTGTSSVAAYYSPLTRAHELGIGALVAVLVRRRTRLAPVWGDLAALAGLVMVGVAVAAYDGGSAFPGALALLPAGGAALVVLGGLAARDGPVTRALGCAPLRFVGRRSYGFYLWHLPVLVLVDVRATAPLSGVTRAVLVVVAFALACATYALVEDPVRRSAWLRRRPAGVSLAVGVALVAVVLGSSQAARALHRVEPVPDVPVAVAELPASDAVVADVAAAAGLTAAPDDVQPPLETIGAANPHLDETRCDRTYDATEADPCLLRDSSDPDAPVVVIWGDSHAGMWIPGLLALAEERDLKVYGLIHYACPPLLDTPSWHPEEDREYAECDSYTASAVPVVEGVSPDLVVLTGAYHDWRPVRSGSPSDPDVAANEPAWDAGLTASVQALAATGARAAVLSDVATQHEDEATCLPTHADDLAACTTPTDEAVNADHQGAEQAAATAAGATWVPIVPWICTPAPDGVCPPIVAGTVVFKDNGHLSRDYTIHVAAALGTALGLT